MILCSTTRSAGVGRSGTFIVIDCMLARIQSEQTIDIYNYVRYLRTRRMFMVQTEVSVQKIRQSNLYCTLIYIKDADVKGDL